MSNLNTVEIKAFVPAKDFAENLMIHLLVEDAQAGVLRRIDQNTPGNA